MLLLTFSFLKYYRFNTSYYNQQKLCSSLRVQRTVDQNVGDPSMVEVLESWKAEEEPELRAQVLREMRVFPDFVSVEEHNALVDELEPRLRRMRYEFDHWDNAIEGYRETEVSGWRAGNEAVFARVRDVAFGRDGASAALPHVHVLDLAAEGHIRPHVDAVRFCGDVIAGVCLLSPAVMSLRHAHDARAHLALHALLPARSLYIISGVARYNFAHGVLPSAASVWRGALVTRTRRISLICRSRPAPTPTPAS